MQNLAKFRKAFVAFIGLTGLLVSNFAGVEFGEEDAGAALSIFDGLAVLLVTFGVFRVPNAA